MKIKLYELAKELGQESQNLVETVQRLGIDIKNSMSVLGSEEVRTVREHYRKLKPLTKAVATPSVPKMPVTEKRVGATVIRRRKKDEEKLDVAPPSSVVAEEVAPVSDEASEAETQEIQEPIPEPEITETAAPEPEVVASVEPPKPKRFFPSIIKKVGTEQYLGEKVGPKVEKKEKPVKTTTPEAAKQATTAVVAGVKKIREIDLTTPEAAKEAGKRRILERQSSVFRTADYLKRELIHATKKKKNVINRPALKTQITKPAEHKRVVEMGETIAVAELAKALGVKATAVITKLMAMGVTATINQAIDFDTTSLIAHEFQFEVKQKVFREDAFVQAVNLDSGLTRTRSPVVTIMGHVDHGKTSLLDAIRKTNVAAKEAGGITQHIGAYTVTLPKGQITFIDTPGHEAFTAIRARGAKVTDIVVIVVSAVDGVMPQTMESISHAQAGSVPVIVAVNKMDLPDATPDRIKQTLAGHNLNPEEWGGDTIYVNVSAKTGLGLDKLLESILLQAEMMELRANYDTDARGTVIESRLDKARGPVATVLVQHGVLKAGDLAICGSVFGNVRAMTDSFGKKLSEAGPGVPVEVLGLPEVPSVGDEFLVAQDERVAKELTASRFLKKKEKQSENRPKLTLEEMMATPATEKELRVILKADVQGTEEALKEAISKFPVDKIRIKILHIGTGGVTEGDVMLAAASKAVVLAFNVRPDIKASKLAESEGVEIRTYNIIYELLDDLKRLLEGLLDKVIKEKVIGRAEIRSVFHIPKIGAIAGSAVIDGKVTRGCHVRLLRDNRIVFVGKLSSLKRFKDDVKEVSSGFECGIGVENFNDLKQGDQFEAFLKEESQGTL